MYPITHSTNERIDSTCVTAFTPPFRCVMMIFSQMMEDGILPEAAINRCLVEVCANDPDFDAMHAFDVLDWGKYRVPRNGNNTATISR